MDVAPQSKAAVDALNAFDASCKRRRVSVCGIDTTHRCNTNQCKFFVWKNVAVCQFSRHTHVCSDRCSLTVTKSDGVYCELTARQISGPQLQQFLNKTVQKYGRERATNTGTQQKYQRQNRRQKRRARQRQSLSRSSRCLQTFCPKSGKLFLQQRQGQTT